MPPAVTVLGAVVDVLGPEGLESERPNWFASVSLDPDPQPSFSTLPGLTWTAVLLSASRGRSSHTVQAVFNAFLSPHPDPDDCEHAGIAGGVFFQPDGRCRCDSLC